MILPVRPPRSEDDIVTELVRGVPVRCYADRPHSVVQVLQQALDVSGDDVLLVDPALGSTTTYGHFARLVEGAAEELRERGVRPGDRVAVLARNGLAAAVAIWACARARAVHVGVAVDAPAERVAALAELTGPVLAFAQPELAAPDIVEALRSTGAPLLDAAQLLQRERAWRVDEPLPHQDDTYSLIATSGTTGRPKAVRVTGRMTGHAAAFYTRALGLGPADRTVIHLPFAWVSGHVTQLTPAMLSGGSAVTMDAFSAPDLVRVVQEHSATWLDVVPSIWELLLRTTGFGLPALSGVRLAVFGGAPARQGTLEQVRERLPSVQLVDVYALSETCAPVTCLTDAEARRHPGTVGRPVPYVELRLIGTDGQPGSTGEIQVRSAVVTPGYWGDEPSPLTADGWLATGDAGRLDEHGVLSVVGREVDLIIRGGVNIAPSQVEQALLSTGLLADAVVVGVPSRVTGQGVGAAVVARPGARIDPRVLRAVVRDAIGLHAVPRPLRIVDVLPRNGHGKLDRRAALALLTDGVASGEP